MFERKPKTYLLIARMPTGTESVLTAGTKQRIDYMVAQRNAMSPCRAEYRRAERDAWWMANYGRPFQVA